MNLAVKLGRSLQTDIQAELRDIERAVVSGTRDTGRGLRTELRRQVTSAGLGQRLANSWRDQHYPNQKLDAASVVYTEAPQIIRAFDEGAVIRSRHGRFLAIPTENAPGEGRAMPLLATPRSMPSPSRSGRRSKLTRPLGGLPLGPDLRPTRAGDRSGCGRTGGQDRDAHRNLWLRHRSSAVWNGSE
jgi:hypothetical protein